MTAGHGDPVQEPAAALAQRLQRREVAAEAVCRAHLERIAARDPAVQAWAWIDPEAALARARRLDAGPILGPLHGVPVGIKDIIDTADMPTGYGSPIYAGNRPAWDAACVALIRRAGGLVLGKTATTEFASSHPARTTHPLNPRHTPGGSSSGSAAAVADGMVPLALGTQTGGSVIRPASFCGIVGYKPGFGLVNRHGVKPLSESLDTVGVMGRSVADAALLASVIAGRPALRDLPAVGAPRIGVFRAGAWEHAQRETLAALADAVARLSAAGARVSDAPAPAGFDELDHVHHRIEFFEMAHALAFEMNRHAPLLSAKLRARLEEGAAIDPADYERCRWQAAEVRGAIDPLFLDCDVLLTAAAPGEAPEGLQGTGSAVFNRVWTLLHLPCIAVPAGTGARQLPVGLQVIGRAGADRATLAAAAWIEHRLRH